MLSIISTLLKYVGILISMSFPQGQHSVNANKEIDLTSISISIKNSGDDTKLVRTDFPISICHVSRKSSHQLLKTRFIKRIVSPSCQGYKYGGKKENSNLCVNRTPGFPIRTRHHRMQRGDVSKSDDPLV